MDRRPLASSHLQVSPGAYIWLALMLLILPLQWLFAAIFAAAVHELGHYAAIRLTGGRVSAVRLRRNGAIMEMLPANTAREAVCALAGPICGGILILFYRCFPRVAVCAFVQTAFNLLPIYPLDGGRAVDAICRCYLTERSASAFCRAIAVVCIIVLCILSAYTAFALRLGLLAFIPLLMILLKTKNRKMPCKQALQRVQ